MNIFLDESNCKSALLPFTLTRHSSEIRVGILTIAQKWKHLTGATIHTYAHNLPQDTITIPANVIPNSHNVNSILSAAANQLLPLVDDHVFFINHPWHIYQYNARAIQHDFELITRHRTSQSLTQGNFCDNPQQLFIEEGAVIHHTIFNTADGPVYIGKHAVIMEGSLIRGPFALGDSALVKMGSVIYGGTSIGPHCIVGGEIKNSVLFGYSNKAHHGYLGDSVIGAWCNLGAGTSNSNVKNTGSNVTYQLQQNAGHAVSAQKGGLLMGDYSRSAINTSFNTGAVVGVCCNIFGDVSSKKYFDNFSWGNEYYRLAEALTHIAHWKKMKGQQLTNEEQTVLENIYNNKKNN